MTTMMMLSLEPGVVVFFVPILVSLGAFTMVYLINKQENETKQKMIEHGMNPKDASENKTPTPGALKFGGLLIGAGLGLFTASMLTNYLDIADEEAIYFGLIAVLGGIGLIIAHQFARKQYFEDKDRY